MKVPTRTQTETYLDEAASLNLGPWIDHSRLAGQLAQSIAERHPELDPDVAYAMGCLHDIGRRVGVTGGRHIIDGYSFMMDEGYDDAARIYLTHSFPTKEIGGMLSPRDWSDDEHAFLLDFLNKVEFNIYDKLVQLCDSVALPPSGCLIEKRLIDATLRYGLHANDVEATLKRWRAYLALKTQISREIGCSIYTLLPDIVENTFGFPPAD